MCDVRENKYPGLGFLGQCKLRHRSLQQHFSRGTVVSLRRDCGFFREYSWRHLHGLSRVQLMAMHCTASQNAASKLGVLNRPSLLEP